MNAVTEVIARWRDNYLPSDGIGKAVVVVLGVYLLGAVLLGMYWSITPKPFDVQAKAQALTAEEGGTVVTGSVTMGSLIGVVETLLNKPGGYTHK